jgi:hypothetical protein
MLGWNPDIFCHSAVIIFEKTVDFMRLAHPVLASFAKATFVARSDLIHRNAVANFKLFDILACIGNNAEELVPRNKWRFHPCRLSLITPEHRCVVFTLQIPGTNATAFCLNQQIIRATLRHRIILFKSVISLPIRNQSFHCFRNAHQFILRFLIVNCICHACQIVNQATFQRYECSPPLQCPNDLVLYWRFQPRHIPCPWRLCWHRFTTEMMHFYPCFSRSYSRILSTFG